MSPSPPPSLPPSLPPPVNNPSFDWNEIPEALRLLDDGGVSAVSSYIYIDGVFRIYANQAFSEVRPLPPSFPPSFLLFLPPSFLPSLPPSLPPSLLFVSSYIYHH